MFWLLYEKFNTLPLFAGALMMPIGLLILVSTACGILCLIPEF